MSKKKSVRRKFRIHAVMVVDEYRKLELMFNSGLDRVTVRAVVEGIPQQPYSKSEVFYDESGAFFMINGGLEDDELSYVKFYLDNFKRVQG